MTRIRNTIADLLIALAALVRPKDQVGTLNGGPGTPDK